MSTRILSLLGLVLALGASGTASAHRPIVVPAVGVDVALECEGRSCDEVTSGGQRWVIGEYGTRYTITLTNRSDVWVEAVVTVDGRSVIDGDRTSSRSRGYLVPPRDRIEIEGWRVSSAEVAAFRFTSVGDSYAGRVGDASQAGTVRVDVYPERAPAVWIPPPREPLGFDEDTRPAPARPELKRDSAATSSGDAARWWDGERQNLGTQYGEHRWQPVAERSFERADPHRPARTLTLRYDDRRGLAARGILGKRRWIVDDDPHWVPPPPPAPPWYYPED